jgi:uncharacterized delta-60 repeat protein
MKLMARSVALALLCILASSTHVNAQSFTPHWDVQPDTDWNMAYGPYKHVPGTEGSPFGGPISGPCVGQGQYIYIASPTWLERWSMAGGWEVLGYLNGYGDSFYTIAIQGDEVYVAGDFDKVYYPYPVGGEYVHVCAHDIAKYNISTGTWSAVGDDDLDSFISSLTTDTDTTGFYPNGEDYSGSVRSMTVDAKGNIYLGMFSGNPQMLFEWNHTTETWTSIGGFYGSPITAPAAPPNGGYQGEGDAGVFALANDGTNVFVAGGFFDVTNSDNSVVTSPCFVKWDTTNFCAMAIDSNDEGGLYDTNAVDVVGAFGFTMNVMQIAVSGTNVFVAGSFRETSTEASHYGLVRCSSVTGKLLPCPNLYVTNSSSGGLPPGAGTGVTAQNGNIYVVGSFPWIGYNADYPPAVNGIAMWTNDGSADGTWSSLSTGLTHSAGDTGDPGYVASDTNAVFAFGYTFGGYNFGFDYAGSVAVPNITSVARWMTGAETNLESDPGFESVSIGAFDTVWAVAVQANGQILVAGTLSTIDGNSCNCVARLNADGSLDTTFTANAASAIPDYWWDAFCIGVDSSGKIYVGGDGGAQLESDIGSGYLLRLNSNGTLDTTFTNTEFGESGGDYATVNTLVVTPVTIEAGGTFNTYDGHSIENSASLIITDGSYDTPWFATDGGESVISYLGDYDL